MKILIGYDGSEFSDSAIEDLKLAGLPDDSEVLIVSVGDLLMSSTELSEVIGQAFTSSRVEAGLKKALTHAGRITKDAENAASRAKERIRELFPGWNVRAEVMIGTPEWVLIDVADKWNADLVVVGSHGRSALRRLLLGSVSKKVVTDSHSSVRVGRPSNRKDADAPPRIIVGVDGSPAAEQAIYEVGKRVWPNGTEVRLIAVDDGFRPHSLATRLPQAAAMISDHIRNREARVSSMLDWAAKEFGAIGLRTSTVTDKGDAASILLAHAEQWAADSIFVGTRDFKSGFERFRLGSVSTAVVTKASCSVEVVRSSRVESSAGVIANGASAA
jgi:nucleotide-binding universal stress UspA family protein